MIPDDFGSWVVRLLDQVRDEVEAAMPDRRHFSITLIARNHEDPHGHFAAGDDTPPGEVLKRCIDELAADIASGSAHPDLIAQRRPN